MEKIKNNKDYKKIKDEILDTKKALMNLNFQKSTGQLEKTSNIKKNRKMIAQLKTKLSQLINNIGDKNA
tara:strand:- start:182 stop:388 length:207 start_codon:yes stop_codon:yes gene_type:complete